jgi:hypothetical protein
MLYLILLDFSVAQDSILVCSIRLILTLVNRNVAYGFYLGLGGICYRLANLESWATVGSILIYQGQGRIKFFISAQF